MKNLIMYFYLFFIVFFDIIESKYNEYPFYHKPPFKKYCNIKDKVIIK